MENNWRKKGCGRIYLRDPFRVSWMERQRYWVAQKLMGVRLPAFIGTFKTAKEAMAACDVEIDRLQEAWKPKDRDHDLGLTSR